jgi:nucleotide-binding universal stress UspA family protein
MVATDGSDGANRAIAVASNLAAKFGSRLHIVTVAENLPSEGKRELARREGTIGDVLESLAMQTLLGARDTARRLGVSDIQIATLWGDPTEQIIEASRHERVDAIVVGRRGRGRLAGLLLGSVSQKVVCLAPTVVIVVP